MNIYYLILEIFYFIIIGVIAIFTVFNFIKTKSITSKIIGALTVVMLVFRLLLIR